MTDDRRFTGPKGEVLRFLRTAADTDGALVEIETVLGPGMKGPPLHVHLRETESFRISEGELSVRTGRRWSGRAGCRWSTHGPGDRLTVPPGVAHTFANRSEATAAFVVVIEPPDPFETMVRMRLAAKRMPLLELAEVHHGDDATLMLAYAPVFAQRLVWNGLAAVARIVRR